MKLYLDDIRPCPDGYILVKTAFECISLLQLYFCSEISLDHDLGDDLKFGTGYDVILWIEEQVYTNNYSPPVIRIHSSNTSARKKMELGIKSINKYMAKIGE